jgi:hypothetical protein
MYLNPNKPSLNSSLHKAAEFSGASRRIPLPEPAFIANPLPVQRNYMAIAKDL